MKYKIDFGELLFIIFVIGFVILLFFFITMELPLNSKVVTLNQETADDVCKQLTGNKTAIVKDWWDYPKDEVIKKGQLACELPNFDSTHNIIIKSISQ